ncbi:MAG: SRPBCC family protein, partial [Chloroflexota bacterium]
MMARITTSRIINAPAHRVWDVLSDYHNPQVFHPFLESVDQLSEIDRGLGATRQCNLYNNSSIVEEVIDWEEGKSFTVMTSDQPIFGETTGTMRVEAVDVNRSKVTVNTSYTPTWGVFGKILDVFLLRIGVSYAVRRV